MVIMTILDKEKFPLTFVWGHVMNLFALPKRMLTGGVRAPAGGHPSLESSRVIYCLVLPTHLRLPIFSSLDYPFRRSALHRGIPGRIVLAIFGPGAGMACRGGMRGIA